MTRDEVSAQFDKDKIVLDGLSRIAKDYVSDGVVNAALNAAEAYTRKHMLNLISAGVGNPDTLSRERMRYAIAAGMVAAAASPLASEGGRE